MLPEEQNSHTAAAPHHAEHREVQAPLLLHEMQSAEEAFGLPPATRRPQQVVVVALLVVGAVACIFAMRRFGLGALPAFGGPELDYTPAQTTSAVSAKQVLADLERSRKAVQVSADHIKHDPFELAGVVPIEAPYVDPDEGAKARARRVEEERLAREKLLNEAFGKLELQGVMLGTVPVARINGELVKVGMTVGEHFTVLTIEGRGVTLLADGKSFELVLDVGADESGGSRPKK